MPVGIRYSEYNIDCKLGDSFSFLARTKFSSPPRLTKCRSWPTQTAAFWDIALLAWIVAKEVSSWNFPNYGHNDGPRAGFFLNEALQLEANVFLQQRRIIEGLP